MISKNLTTSLEEVENCTLLHDGQGHTNGKYITISKICDRQLLQHETSRRKIRNKLRKLYWKYSWI